MKELSLNILDIAENSVSAGAGLTEISIDEDLVRDLLSITIRDNGKGMSPEFLERVTDPFTTTRTTRKVGMGIPLFKEAAESCGGKFHISSELGKGTLVQASFGHSHIDRMPLGDIAGTISTLVQCHPEADFLYTHRLESESLGQRSFSFDTRELRETLEGVSLNTPDVVFWIKGFMEEKLQELYGGI